MKARHVLEFVGWLICLILFLYALLNGGKPEIHAAASFDPNRITEVQQDVRQAEVDLYELEMKAEEHLKIVEK